MTPRSTSESEPSPEQGGGSPRFQVTRRAIFAGAAGLGLGAGLERASSQTKSTALPAGPGQGDVPFYGEHQAGIATHPQAHVQFAAFDLTAPTRRGVHDLLGDWSSAGAVLAAGHTVTAAGAAGRDPGEAAGLSPAQLTLTFGLGPMFGAQGRDRLGLGNRRPDALRPLPAFAGEDLDPGRSGGDLCVQACANDPQVAFHALHVLVRIAGERARLRWSLSGFRALSAALDIAQTPRNLLGFKDGTNNLDPTDPTVMDRYVWVQPGDGPAWMAGGAFLIVRQIEFDLSSWDALSSEEQDQTIGRHKQSGAPLGGRREHDTVNLRATDRRGNLVIPSDAHIRVAGSEANHGIEILRRSYSFTRGSTGGGADRAGGELDGGLLFVAFVRNPAQFIALQRRLSTGDALSAFTIHIGSAIFACPPGPSRSRSIGHGLLA